jgi:beta-lactamase regulating signal transducer with metallopeptidase domain
MLSYTLLPKILNMSLTGGIVIALVLLIRLPLRKAPKIFSYALWAVVLFRLLCPVSFSSDFSLLNFFNSPTVTENSITYIPADIAHNVNQQVNLPISGISNAVNNALMQSEEQTATNPLEEPMAIGTLLWLAGIAAMLIYSVISLLKLKRKLTGAVWLRGNIYLADHVTTPFVIGVIRSRIYLPSALSERERDYIILHEQTHIRRLDHIVKLVAFLALSIHWFNPLVWVAFVCCMKDMEMSCDEAVMKKMGDGIRADYSSSLLSLATGRKILAGAPLAFGEGNTKGRIKNIMNFKKPAAWVIITAVIVCVVITVCLLTNPEDKYADSPYQWTNSVTVADVSSCSYTIREEQSFTSEVTDSQLEELVGILNSIEPETIHTGRGIPGIISVMVRCGNHEYLMRYGGDVVEITFDSETADLYGDGIWEIHNDALNAFMENLLNSDMLPTSDDETAQTANDAYNTSATASEQAQAVLDSVVSDGTTAMTLTAADGVGGGRYEVPSNPNQVSGFDSSFDWSYAESGAAPSP